ncbi:MAG: RNA polymerase sigma factor [Acidobacteriota bacterium]|nr:MAG: RNA polymerase sigma factor [Acidobacteriota bacterium]
MEACAIPRSEPPPQPEEQVVRARAGDLSAFEELYREHVDRVYALCLRMTANAERAEELTQEAFVRVWERLRTFRGESPFGRWLRTIAINTVLADWRSSGRLRALERGLDEMPPLASNEAASASRLDLEAAIAKLPAGARTVFVLHDIEGLRHEEIARLVGSATGTSKAQLHRARRLLREALRR